MGEGRRRHYGVFYGLTAPPSRPLALVHGNCQAESLRVLLGGSPTLPYAAVRIPPVHELTGSDVPHLRRLLGRTGLLASQPVRDGYRALPIGTGELAAALPRGARVVRWPVIRHPALHPWSVIVRHPDDPAAAPPPVPYHDLRALAAAAGRPPGPGPTDAGLREVGDRGVAELARRERRDTDVGVSDLVLPLGARAAHTLNHPGNDVLIALARRIQDAVGAPADAADPGRVLLGGVRAPLTADVIRARGLDASPRPGWERDGTAISEARVRAEQIGWYATHPGWVEAGLRRHAETFPLLGL